MKDKFVSLFLLTVIMDKRRYTSLTFQTWLMCVVLKYGQAPPKKKQSLFSIVHDRWKLNLNNETLSSILFLLFLYFSYFIQSHKRKVILRKKNSNIIIWLVILYFFLLIFIVLVSYLRIIWLFFFHFLKKNEKPIAK